jgi:hypothetical protein
VPDTKLPIWAEAHTSVYINCIYRVLGSEEIQVTTDASGTLTVVEATEDMNATTLSVSLLGDTLTTVIDPMATGFDKASTLDSSGSLRSATYAEDEVVGGPRHAVSASRRPHHARCADIRCGQEYGSL